MTPTNCSLKASFLRLGLGCGGEPSSPWSSSHPWRRGRCRHWSPRGCAALHALALGGRGCFWNIKLWSWLRAHKLHRQVLWSTQRLDLKTLGQVVERFSCEEDYTHTLLRIVFSFHTLEYYGRSYFIPLTHQNNIHERFWTALLVKKRNAECLAKASPLYDNQGNYYPWDFCFFLIAVNMWYQLDAWVNSSSIKKYALKKSILMVMRFDNWLIKHNQH